ncbi:hypothetical protein yangon129_13080 [Helicobacter pylori]
MMRIVVFDVSGVLEAFDYRGVLFHDSALEITEQPQVKEITNELLKQLQSTLKPNSLFYRASRIKP